MGDGWTDKTVDVISTGSISLDLALGVGGLPRRIIEIIGPEMSGKTTFALQAVAQAQRNGERAAFIDAEHAFDPLYAEGIGVDVSKLYVSQPDYGEQGLDICEELTNSKAFGIIVIDSVAALVPKAELDGEMKDQNMGLQARMMSKACRKLTGIASKSKTCLVFINQIRQKIGIVFGSRETTPGGNALKFYSSVRLDVRRIQSIKKGEEIIGNRVRVKVIKNKVAPPFRKAELNILFGIGIDQIADLIEMGLNTGVIEKEGDMLMFGKRKIGKGFDGCREKLYDNADLFDEITAKVLMVIK
jgi:recombination protein RecA